jgi:adenosylhomocysteine nucleosidase
MDLCSQGNKMPHRSISLWQATRNDKAISFVKAGVGPKRSAANLEEALKMVEVSHILAIGYAGALDPDLRVGDLVAVARALAFSLPEDSPAWENVRVDGAFELVDSEKLARSAMSIGLKASIGDVLTSSYVLGNPTHKNLLFSRFHASIVDMETAALACVAASRNVPLSCIRVVSDKAHDTFLEPFSHDPSCTIAARAGKFFDKGMVQTYREWKENTRVAKKSLTLFLSRYL